MKSGSNKKQRGFTLIEMLVVIAIAGILMTVAVPGMKNLIEDNRVTGYTNEYLSSIYLARSEAIKRGNRVTICRSSNGTSCSTGTGGWEIGWVVFEDANNDGAFVAADGDILLQHHEKLSNAVTLTGQASKTNNYLSFLQNGTARKTDNTAQFGTLTLGLNSKTRTITLTSIGRVSVSH